jgi:hypothetical protein
MIALGNDVVDLSWRPHHPNRYYDRLLIYAFPEMDPNLSPVQWRQLWSIKEAAYKTSVKLGNENTFKPSEFTVENYGDDSHSGIINWKQHTLYYKTELRDSYCHSFTFVRDPDEVNIRISQTRKRYFHQHHRARILAMEMCGHDVMIIKSPKGIPLLIQNSKLLEKEISIAHEGSQVAVATSI